MSKRFTIVGAKYRGHEAFVRNLPIDEPLTLVREPTNKHDRNAIQVHARGLFVAYVAAIEAKDLAPIMDGAPTGTPFIGKLARAKGFTYVELDV